MTKQCKLVVTHRLAARADQPARQRHAVSTSQLVQPAPATNGQELVIRRRADGTTKLSRQSIDRLTARAKGLLNRATFQFPGIGIQSQHVEAGLPNELSDWRVDT